MNLFHLVTALLVLLPLLLSSLVPPSKSYFVSSSWIFNGIWFPRLAKAVKEGKRLEETNFIFTLSFIWVLCKLSGWKGYESAWSDNQRMSLTLQWLIMPQESV